MQKRKFWDSGVSVSHAAGQYRLSALQHRLFYIFFLDSSQLCFLGVRISDGRLFHNHSEGALMGGVSELLLVFILFPWCVKEIVQFRLFKSVSKS